MNQLSTSPLVGDDTFILVEYALGTDMLDSCGVLIKVLLWPLDMRWIHVSMAGAIGAGHTSSFNINPFKNGIPYIKETTIDFVTYNLILLIELNDTFFFFPVICLCGNMEVQIADRRFGRTNLAIYGPKWAQKKRKPKPSLRAKAEKV
ncbi:hypothetical protein LguiB_010280 [Lonicera macranthoides]